MSWAFCFQRRFSSVKKGSMIDLVCCGCRVGGGGNRGQYSRPRREVKPSGPGSAGDARLARVGTDRVY
jgi:hypothetical protein